MPDQNPVQTGSNHSQERILKNAGYLTAAFVLQKILSFLYFVYISRIIGPVDLGFYDPAKSLIPIFLILIDFSLSVVMVREIARKPEKTEELLSSVLGIKIIFALAILLGMGLFTNLSGYSALVKTVLYLDGMIVALDTFTLTFFAVFRGIQNMKYEALGMIITQMLTVIFGVTGLYLGFDMKILFFSVLAGSLFNFLFSYTMLRKKLHIRIKLAWNKTIIKTFLITALPFALNAMLVKVYTYTDRYMLLAIVGQGAVGWYVVAHKFTYALEFIPSSFSASIFPAMSAFYVSSKEQLAKTFEKAMHYLLIISLPISLGIFVMADKIVISLSGPAYSHSIAPLRILIVGLIVIFLNFPVGALLNACNRQKTNTVNMAIAVSINVILNIILIRQYSLIGAAISALVTGFLLFFLGLRVAGTIITINRKFLINSFIKTLGAASVMAIVLYFFKKIINISVNFGRSAILLNAGILLSLGIYVVIGLIVYVTVLLLFKGFTIDDARFIYKKLTKRT